MDHLDRLESDLNFVRNVVNGSARSKSPSSLYFLWAVIVAIGFSLVDFRVELVPQYWAVAGPAGFLVSAYLGWSYAQRIGQPSSSDGKRHLLHWAAVSIVIALAVLLGLSSGLPARATGTLIVLLLSLGYFTAGLHLDRFFLWVGVLLAAGAIVVTFVEAYAWTGVGIAVAGSLTVAGIRQERSRETIA